MRGQVSAELIIIIAALLAVALVLVTQLQRTAVVSSEKMANKTSDVLGAIDSMGPPCQADEDCLAGYECSGNDVCVKAT